MEGLSTKLENILNPKVDCYIKEPISLNEIGEKLDEGDKTKTFANNTIKGNVITVIRGIYKPSKKKKNRDYITPLHAKEKGLYKSLQSVCEEDTEYIKAKEITSIATTHGELEYIIEYFKLNKRI